MSVTVVLTGKWWKLIHTEEFDQWLTENNIHEKWRLSTIEPVGNPCIVFEDEYDAIAFRLRFTV